MDGRKTFIFYTEWKEIIKDYSPELRLELYEAIVDYALGRPVELSHMAKFVFPFLQKRLDEDMKRYEAVCERNRENGKKGGRKTQVNPKNPSEPKKPTGLFGNPKNPSEPTETQKTQVNPKNLDNDNDDDNELSLSKDNLNNKKDEQSSSKKEIRDEFFLHRLIDAINQDEHQGWREVMMKNFRIENFHQAMQDYQDWLIATTMENDVHNISDFKRIFNYNAKKFLSEEALHYRAKPVIINGIEYN